MSDRKTDQELVSDFLRIDYRLPADRVRGMLAHVAELEAERDKLRGQLAKLADAAEEHMVAYGSLGSSLEVEVTISRSLVAGAAAAGTEGPRDEQRGSEDDQDG